VGFLCNLYNNNKRKLENVHAIMGIVDFNVFQIYNKIGITKNEYYESWIKLIGFNNLEKSKLFYTTAEDRREVFSFKVYVSKVYSLNLEILENFNLNEFMHNIKNAGLIISGRMHALVVAKAFEKKYITYPISEKLLQFDLMYKNKNIVDIQNDILNKFNIII
jgi:hypothetical protein